MPEVAHSTGNVVIPVLSTGIVFKGERLQYLPEDLIQHLSVCLPLLIGQFLRIVAVLD